MESNAGVSRLLELIFGKKATISDEIVAHSSISSSLPTEGFSKKLAFVFKVKKRIVSLRWSKFFDGHCRIMLSSKERYLMHVMYTCILQHECIRNIFKSFISVCALVMHLSEETLEKTGVDFRDLNFDIVMVFYQNVMNSFLGRSGIDPFVEYICGHKYLKWDLDTNDLTLSDEPTSSVFPEADINKKILEEVNKNFPIQEVPDGRRATIENTTASLVVEVLKNTSFKFPTLPSESELIKRLVAYRKQEKAKKAEGKSRAEAALTNATSHGNSSSNADSKTDYFAEQREDIACNEDVVQAVIRLNLSDNLGHGSANCQIEEEAGGILDHLKTGINSLIEVLGECENE